MKHSLFRLSLLSVLTGLASLQASLAQGLSDSYAVRPLGPSDASTAAAVINAKIEPWGYSFGTDLSRDRTGTWQAHVLKSAVEVAVSVDKGGRIIAQSTSTALAVRCNQLYAIASRYVSGGAGAQGSSGSSLAVIGAGLDCEKGRYDEGIKALEKLLNGQRISYPPS
jgi:hypothetical protein